MMVGAPAWGESDHYKGTAGAYVYTYQCAANAYRTAVHSVTSTESCVLATVCDEAVQYETQVPTATSDRVCATLTACSSGLVGGVAVYSEYQAVAPTATTDRTLAASNISRR